MLRFLSRFRLRHLSENRVIKYLLYTIGEILLIVTGILIALQVNDWNEERIRDIESKRLLKNLIVELDYDRSFFTRYSKYAGESLERFKRRNQMIYDGIGLDDIDTLLTGPLAWSLSFETPQDSYRQLVESGLLWELSSPIDSIDSEFPYMTNSNQQNLGELIRSYYQLFDLYKYRSKENIDLLNWMISKDNNIGFKRAHRDYMRTRSTDVLRNHPWLFRPESDNYKKMMDLSEGRIYYCRSWIRRANDLLKLNAILQKEIKAQIEADEVNVN